MSLCFVYALQSILFFFFRVFMLYFCPNLQLDKFVAFLSMVCVCFIFVDVSKKKKKKQLQRSILSVFDSMTNFLEVEMLLRLIQISLAQL